MFFVGLVCFVPPYSFVLFVSVVLLCSLTFCYLFINCIYVSVYVFAGFSFIPAILCCGDLL